MQQWSLKKIKPAMIHRLKTALSPYHEIYDVFLWTLATFPVIVPKGVLQFFNCLSQPSPVCSYLFPSEECLELADKLYTVNVKMHVETYKEIYEKLPVFFHLLNSLFESSLPLVWKPLIRYLILKSQKPFVDAANVPETAPSDEDSMDFFPCLKKVRGRGKFELDNEAESTVCNKYYRGHPKLTPGIFTIYCPHG